MEDPRAEDGLEVPGAELLPAFLASPIDPELDALAEGVPEARHRV